MKQHSKTRSETNSDRTTQTVANAAPNNPQKSAKRIVSSAHLISERCPESSEFEFAMILAINSFNRWVVRCMAAAGVKDMTTMEVLLLHHVHHRNTKKKLADICFMYNIEDTHVVSYSLQKLVKKLKFVKSEKIGKEVFFSTTNKGAQAIEGYRKMREQCLIDKLCQDGDEKYELGKLAEFLRQLSALYDQAAREATSLYGDPYLSAP
jgi:predicted MarR family transcription regulator